MPRAPSDEAGGSVSDGGDSIIIRGPKKGVEAVRKEVSPQCLLLFSPLVYGK